MKLRAKLFVPLIIVSIVFGAYSYYVWLPEYIQTFLANQKEDTRSHIRTAAEGLVPLLLEDRLANVYDNLDTLLEQNSKWLNITLSDRNGKLVYPLNVPTLPVASETIQIYEQPVSFGGPPIANLTLYADLSPAIENSNELVQRFQIAFTLLLLFLILLIGGIVEFLVRRPIQGLSVAAAQLSNGVYSSKLPNTTADEIGDLVKNFIHMRDSIEAYHSKLIGEITNHKATEKELIMQKEMASYQAAHDNLTGLFNRREFEKRVKASLESLAFDKSQHVLLYMDLDQFKVVNDTCGHIAGDNLLCQLAAILQQKITEKDTIARLGGDEFGILFKDCDISAAFETSTELLNCVHDFRFSWDNKLFRIGASIGLVELKNNRQDYFSLLSAADSACYTAKDNGRNRIQIYQSEDAELTKQKGEMLWLSRINKALEEGRMLLYCQPISPLKKLDLAPKHYEVLIRMVDNDGTLIYPESFIPAAERYNLITTIDRWVIDNSFAFLHHYYQSNNASERLKLSFNLSGGSLGDNDTLEFIENAFVRYNPPARTIGIEITETAAIQKLSHAISFMEKLKKLGCEFYLDDFGSGLSSFNYLKSLPADIVKIDGGFVKDLDSNPLGFAMVKSINEIAHVMGKKTIAEFVGNQYILDELRKIGVDYAQGFYNGKPFPLNDLLDNDRNYYQELDLSALANAEV